ncbi:MAG: hypothetical protein Q9198_004723 [Flavoplaca austrocitrina]
MPAFPSLLSHPPFPCCHQMPVSLALKHFVTHELYGRLLAPTSLRKIIHRQTIPMNPSMSSIMDYIVQLAMGPSRESSDVLVAADDIAHAWSNIDDWMTVFGVSRSQSLELLRGETSARKLNPAKMLLTAIDNIRRVGPDDPRER